MNKKQLEKKLELNSKKLRKIVLESRDLMKRLAVVNLALDSRDLTDTALSQLKNEIQAINFKLWDILKGAESNE